MAFTDAYKFDTLAISSPKPYVLQVDFDRAEKQNSMTVEMWREIGECFQLASIDEHVRAVIFSGKGDLFTSGLDMAEAAKHLAPLPGLDIARIGMMNYKFVGRAQESISSIQKCLKPVIAAVHGDCIGGGIDVITACDIRLCSENARFSAKEIDAGIVPDLGILQRLGKVLGNDSLCRELCFTGRNMGSDEALSCGLVSKILKNRDELMKYATELAVTIASKSPVAVQGTKHNLNYSRDHSVAESLEYMKSWNATMLQSEDIMKSVRASMEGKSPADVEYHDL